MVTFGRWLFRHEQVNFFRHHEHVWLPALCLKDNGQHDQQVIGFCHLLAPGCHYQSREQISMYLAAAVPSS